MPNNEMDRFSYLVQVLSFEAGIGLIHKVVCHTAGLRRVTDRRYSSIYFRCLFILLWILRVFN